MKRLLIAAAILSLPFAASAQTIPGPLNPNVGEIKAPLQGLGTAGAAAGVQGTANAIPSTLSYPVAPPPTVPPPRKP
jgi:hypothetical protein